MKSSSPSNKNNKAFVSRVKLNQSIAFLQRPPSNRYTSKDEDEDLKATDLFCRFTADIIKEDVQFIR